MTIEQALKRIEYACMPCYTYDEWLVAFKAADVRYRDGVHQCTNSIEECAQDYAMRQLPRGGREFPDEYGETGIGYRG